MKKISILLFAAGMMALTSCNSYLDELPDDRAEVNSIEKVKQFLVSAYPTHSPLFIFNESSDDVTDNGVLYNYQPNQMQAYRWLPIETEGNDDPKSIWNSSYEAVSTANQAMEAISAMGEPAECEGMKAEALLCRAFAMFQLANTFCMAWNPEKADEYMGVPYPMVSGVTVEERGTLAELYGHINDDIEAALPHVNDTYLSAPKYHFNVRAAYAFAARFNLYYLNYDKAIQYATKALGTNPSAMCRQIEADYGSLAGVDDIHNKWIRSGENCNWMMQPYYSLAGHAGYSSSFKRFAHNFDIIKMETFWAKSPWCTGAASGENNNALAEAGLQYGNNQMVRLPKLDEDFEITDKVNNTGYAHIVDVAFSGDETLLVRAEAYAMKKQYTEALADMNIWLTAHARAASPRFLTLTVDNVNSSMDAIREPEVPARTAGESSIKKHLNPQGFSIEEGTQTNMVQVILHMRRINNWWQGLRWLDIKRWGIEITHHLEGEDALLLKAGDPRGAIQLPTDVIDAGLPANPREN